MGGTCRVDGEKRNAYKLLVGKPKGKRPLGRPRRGLMDNIKIDRGDRMGWLDWDWSGSGQGQVESSCECGNEPSGFIKC
jgi:hypothetical protein